MSHKKHGRKEPYTDIGVRRLPCVRCGRKATAQWSACADGLQRPICEDCDVAINAWVLHFMRIPNAGAKILRYVRDRRAARR